MESFNKQLVINHLGLPREIIRIIKDYTFMDIIMSTSKNNKNNIINLINNTTWSSRSQPEVLDEGVYIFWIEEDQGSLQFQTLFCKKCGNYCLMNNLEVQNNIICNCGDEHL
jgi:hypothetical protein